MTARRAGSMRSNHVDRLRGGQADRMSPSDFDSVALAKGTLHEMEHTDDPDIAEEIAMDHLAEDEGYYEKLNAMERGYFRNGSVKWIPENRPSLWKKDVSDNKRSVGEVDWGWLKKNVPSNELYIEVHPWGPNGERQDSLYRWFQAPLTVQHAKKYARELIESGESASATIDARWEPRWGRKRLAFTFGEMTSEMSANSGSYYVWPLSKDGQTPLASEGPYGPYELYEAKSFARIGATQGKHSRAVTRGKDPNSKSFEIVRLYKAGTGERVI